MKPKRILAIGSVAIGALLALVIACTVPQEPTPVSQTTTVTVNIGSQASPSPAPANNCPPVLRVGVVATMDGGIVTSFRVRDTPRLDATPKREDSSPVPSTCHGQTVTWGLSGTAACALSGMRYATTAAACASRSA